MNKLIQYVVMAAVGVLLLTSLLIPLTNDAANINGTITNTGAYRMSDITDEAEWVIEWDHTEIKNVKVNGEVVTLNPTPGGIPYTLIGGNDLLVRYFLQSNGVRVFVQEFNTGGTVYAADSNANQDMTITYSSGAVVCDNGSGTTRTVSITDTLYAINPKGDYILKSPDSTALVKGDSQIIGLGTTALANNIDQRFVIVGSLNDGFNASYEPYDTMTMGDITAVYSENTTIPYIGVDNFDKLTFTASYNSTDINVVYSQVFVPYEITAEKAVHADDSTRAIIGVIPLIVIVGLIAGIVGIVAIRRNA